MSVLKTTTFCIVFGVLGLLWTQTALAEAPAERDVTSDAWFRSDRTTNLVAVILFTSVTLMMLVRARRGKRSFIRPISGLDEIEKAVGRAAEMGRPINYVPGLSAVSDPATVASLSILSKVAYRSARLHTRIFVPNFSPITFPVTRSILKDAYTQAGRSEFFNPDDVVYFTSRHMTYTMAVVGMMTREKIATNFLIGHFYSESLILAETGASLGAKQIGACDSVTQLPFFITTCDYTIIGEELFAASAIISDDSMIQATIAAHDIFKALVVGLILLATLLALLSVLDVSAATDMLGTFITTLKGAKG